MAYLPQILKQRPKLPILLASILVGLTAVHSASAGPVHAYYADEHNTSPTTPTGNRILEIDIANMQLVNTIDVPGILGHHADNGFNSKLYGVPKGSGYVNIIELRKDQSGTTSMQVTGQINLTHMPRSGDAYNKKFNIILMTARNRPMGSFINVETDQVVGTIGEDVDCTLTDGTQLLSHADANTIAGATKYQCARVANSHGGDQISGHPYWLTPDYAAIVDRANKQISVYNVWQENNQIKSRLVNHLPTRSSIHQIIPRDRTNLPVNQQADFYATEEGEHVNSTTDYNGGVAHALLKMKLTTSGLQLVSRMDLQRTQVLPKAKADRILNACISIYRSTFNQALTGPSQNRENRYNQLFASEGITRSTDQDAFNDFPVDCFYPGIPGGHNADFAPNNKHLYVPMAGGAMSVVDVNRWKIANNIDIGIRSGVGHTCFSAKNNVAIATHHGDTFSRGVGAVARTIRYINSERPIGYYWINLPFTREGLINTYVSHTCYVDENEDYYYNFFTDGGVFYKIDLTGVFNNPTNGSSNLVVDSLYTGGIPIQGSFIDLDNIKLTNPGITFAAINDTAESNGSAITIDVLLNDTGDNLVLEMVDPANNGTVTVANGKLNYTPNAGFSGTDAFWYGISSSASNTWEWALVTVTVTSTVQPLPLKANKDEVTAVANTATTIDVLANDTGTGISIGWFDSPANGTLGLSTNGKFIYTSNPGFTGTEDLWYEVVDTAGQTTWGNLIITVGGGSGGTVNAINDTATVVVGNTVSIDVLANDTGSSLSIDSVDAVWTGSISIVNGKINYVSDGNYTGLVTVWYGIIDANGNHDGANIAINIVNNTGLSANDDAATVKQGDTILIDVLANDTGSGLTLEAVDDVWTGAISIENGKVKYIASGATGTLDVWYGISDSNGNYDGGNVTITITP